MNRSLRIVWLCHFSNKEVQEILKPRKEINEFAPWITGLIKLFEAAPNIDLHIVSPHEYISGIKEFKLKNINYHFYNSHIPIWGRHWPGFFKFDYWTNFYFNGKTVKKIVSKIKPDLIHLHGAEDAYYSSCILQFKNLYPVLITIQGFISNTTSKGWRVEKRIRYEQKILKTFNHFGCQTNTIKKQVREINSAAILHRHNYPFTIPEYKKVEKIYDIVYFAKITKDKGIEDLISAGGIIKKEIKNLTIVVIGKSQKKYFDFLKYKIAELGLTENITWTGFLSQYEAHKLVARAKVCVLPTYNEIISGTIIESLFLKLPVVAYDVGSIHEVNEKENIIRLVAKGDILALADEIKNLLSNEYLRKEAGERGFLRIHEMFSNQKILDEINSIYNKVIIVFNSSK